MFMVFCFPFSVPVTGFMTPALAGVFLCTGLDNGKACDTTRSIPGLLNLTAGYEKAAMTRFPVLD